MPKADGSLTDQEKAVFYGGLAKEIGIPVVLALKDLIEAASKKGKSLRPPKKGKTPK